jgi:hypothetical protein
MVADLLADELPMIAQTAGPPWGRLRRANRSSQAIQIAPESIVDQLDQGETSGAGGLRLHLILNAHEHPVLRTKFDGSTLRIQIRWRCTTGDASGVK